ncbi:hypothetical protein CUMW_256860 [Citrus unshiu]|uniref:TIR domain-containing protein n=1 Tax=Citrus unshiu TaxID=55188 RepID=A0A2H5QS91_CITUN|nr:hypothetical protein CUMW_256860 [Citrus unshiu]
MASIYSTESRTFGSIIVFIRIKISLSSIQLFLFIMASSYRNNKKYDVFVSFRGEDTRDNFTSHLYSALCRQNIQTFIDDQLNRRDEISESLVNAIEASAISVIEPVWECGEIAGLLKPSY